MTTIPPNTTQLLSQLLLQDIPQYMDTGICSNALKTKTNYDKSIDVRQHLSMHDKMIMTMLIVEVDIDE